MHNSLRNEFLSYFKPLAATLSDHQKDLLSEALWQLGLACLPGRSAERQKEGARVIPELTIFQYGAGIRSAALAITRGLLTKQLTEEKRMAKLGLPFGEDGPR